MVERAKSERRLQKGDRVYQPAAGVYGTVVEAGPDQSAIKWDGEDNKFIRFEINKWLRKVVDGKRTKR